MPTARIAVIGAGVIGQRHLQAIKQSERATLVAIADLNATAATIASDYAVPFYADYRSLFTECQLDGVIVATPTEHHLQPTLDALDAGLHVLVEKPIMASLEEAELVIQRCRARDRHVLVGHHRRFYELVDKTRSLISDGVLGKLVAVTGQWNIRKNAAYYEPDWRKSWKAGPVLTNLIHELDMLRYTCGEILSVSAETANSVQEFDKEDVAALVVRFETGVLGTFILSDQTNSPWSWELATGENPSFPATEQNAMRFMGTEASLEFPNLVLWKHSEQPGDWNKLISPTPIVCEFADAYINQIEHFASVSMGESTPRTSAQDATDTLKTTLAVYEAAETGQRVRI